MAARMLQLNGRSIAETWVTVRPHEVDHAVAAVLNGASFHSGYAPASVQVVVRQAGLVLEPSPPHPDPLRERMELLERVRVHVARVLPAERGASSVLSQSIDVDGHSLASSGRFSSSRTSRMSSRRKSACSCCSLMSLAVFRNRLRRSALPKYFWNLRFR